MATVKPQDREILQEDVQALLANQKPQAVSADPPMPDRNWVRMSSLPLCSASLRRARSNSFRTV